MKQIIFNVCIVISILILYTISNREYKVLEERVEQTEKRAKEISLETEKDILNLQSRVADTQSNTSFILNNFAHKELKEKVEYDLHYYSANLEQFLKKEKVYDLYIKNCLLLNSEDQIRNFDNSSNISSAFEWEKTSEGCKFWGNILDKFLKTER